LDFVLIFYFFVSFYLASDLNFLLKNDVLNIDSILLLAIGMLVISLAFIYYIRKVCANFRILIFQASEDERLTNSNIFVFGLCKSEPIYVHFYLYKRLCGVFVVFTAFFSTAF